MYSHLRTSQRWRLWAICDVLITGEIAALNKELGIWAIFMADLAIKAWGDRSVPTDPGTPASFKRNVLLTSFYEEVYPVLMEVPEIRDFILDAVFTPI